jgi:hypothetical protein
LGPRIDIGDHRIAQQLRDLRLGRMAFGEYARRGQTILTPVLESFAA